jgi:NAD(P)-dependent dehydrogenase (short-subunit alcohol dehydrogenase family)
LKLDHNSSVGRNSVTRKTAIVTGANAGLGFETTRALARNGYRVIMACRNLAKAEEARRCLLEQEAGIDLDLLQLDVSELESIRKFAEQFIAEIGQLDLLVNNAGIVGIPLSRNSAGHEMQMATNYLGAFALTGLLLPSFRTDRQCRIVNVGSLAHRMGKLAFDDFNWERTPYKEMKGYAYSKVALLTFTLELNRRLAHDRKNILALGAHPGFAATDILKKSNSTLAAQGPFRKWFQSKVEPYIPRPVDAARPVVLAACSDSVQGGDYYGPGGILEIAGKPAKARINPVAKVPANGQRLWDISESLTCVRYLS